MNRQLYSFWRATKKKFVYCFSLSPAFEYHIQFCRAFPWWSIRISLIFDIDTNQVKIETTESSVGVVCCATQSRYRNNEKKWWHFSIAICYPYQFDFVNSRDAIWKMCFRKLESSQHKCEAGRKWTKMKWKRKKSKVNEWEMAKKKDDMWIIHGIDSLSMFGNSMRFLYMYTYDNHIIELITEFNWNKITS